MAVGGSEESRHGIILAKSDEAKKRGVKTGDPLWLARQKCPGIVIVPPNYERYLLFSKLAREIYSEFTDSVESFGLDENWCDVTGSKRLFGDGQAIANTIRKRIKRELGITVSVGVSYNKIFAKLGSDMAARDSVAVITRDNFRETVWTLPAGDLLYVGPATKAKLQNKCIYTIGDIARQKPEYLRKLLGVWGVTLWRFANGFDDTPVANIDYESQVKSIGNSTTTPKDLVTDQDVRITLYVLAESVASRLRENGFRCDTVQIYIRYSDLFSFERQGKLAFSSCTSDMIADKAYELYKKNTEHRPIRSLGVRACNLIPEDFTQFSLLPEIMRNEKRQTLESSIDILRYRFGGKSIQRAVMLADKDLSRVDPKNDHVIHPVSFAM